ncbi:TPA: hypothetical protein ACH3X1_012987 [Trebouxia sp. C0004]
MLITLQHAHTSFTADMHRLEWKMLQRTKRTGWIRKGVTGPESIADHMYRMGMMAFISSSSSVDSNRLGAASCCEVLAYTWRRFKPRTTLSACRCIKLAIVHDVAEAIVGDIAPSDNVTKEVKTQLETEALHKIRDMLGADSAAGQEIEALWQEYEDGNSPEALMVKDFDKLEMILQAQEYEAEQDIDLQDFFDSTKGRFTTLLGQSWAKEIVKRRADKQGVAHAKSDHGSSQSAKQTQ